jgi:hypothetical protein
MVVFELGTIWPMRKCFTGFLHFARRRGSSATHARSDRLRRISGNGEAAIAVGDGRRVRPITADHRGHANLNRSVGAGLLANASCQSTPSALNQRVRQQAGSYRLRLAQKGLYGGKPGAGVCRRRMCTAANPVQAFASERCVRRQTQCRRLSQKDVYGGKPGAGVCRRRICTAANPV